MDVGVWQWDKEQCIVIKNNGSQYILNNIP